MRISSAIEQFLLAVSAANLSVKTYRRYRDDLRELERFCADIAMDELAAVSAQTLRAFLDHLIHRANQTHADRSLSPYSIEGKFRTLKRFFNFCHLERMMDENPIVRVARPKLPKRIVERLSEAQVEGVLQLFAQTQQPERNIAMLMLMVYSGLRRGEIVGLRLSEMNLQEGSAIVKGKGNKMRIVPINQATTIALERWLAVRETRLSDRVFVNEWGGPIQGDAVLALFRRVKAKLRPLGVPRFYPHLMRHTFATLYLKRIHDYKTLQLILGHARSSTTLDIYVDFNFEHVKAMHQQAFDHA